EVKPAPPPKEPPKKKEPAFDPGKIAALLNKLPPKEKKEQGEHKAPPTGPQKTQQVGEGTGMTADYRAIVNSQLQACCNRDAGAQGAAKFVVVVHVDVNQDGSLASQPYVVNTAEVSMGGPSYQVAAERAIRAVHRCDPLKNLPADRYSEWQSMDFAFT